MREVISTGKTLEEATEKGCTELGLSRDEVSVEILEMPGRKFFKTIPAKVKVSADDAVPASVTEAPPAVMLKQPQRDKPVLPPQTAAHPKADAERLRQAEMDTAAAPVLAKEPEVQIDLSACPRARAAAEYLQSIFSAMGAEDVAITAAHQGDAVIFRLEGEAIAKKIDIRGEVIQSLSYLADRAVNSGVDKKTEEYLRVRLDVAGYRNRREGELIQLANRVGREVARTGRSRTLAPMNPYERLIIHTAVGKMNGLVSESIGADAERRVVIKSTAPSAPSAERRASSGSGQPGGARRPHQRDASRQSGRDRRDSSGHGGYKTGRSLQSNTPEREYAGRTRDPDAAPTVPERREAIHDGDDLPLYGKIEL